MISGIYRTTCVDDYLRASSLVSLARRLSGGGKGSTGSSKGGGVCRWCGGGQMKGSVVPLKANKHTHVAETIEHHRKERLFRVGNTA